MNTKAKKVKKITKKKAKKEKEKDFRFLISKAKPGPGAAWYVVHTYSGHEHKAVNYLKQRVKTMGLGNKIFEVIIPIRDKFVIRRGEKIKTKQKIFPGYILVRMIFDDQSWITVKTTPGITDFISTGEEPMPISQEEIDKIAQGITDQKPEFETKFSIGEAVKIVDGPFADSLGTIDKIDDKRGKLKVLVSIFDRETPVDVDFLQVSKI